MEGEFRLFGPQNRDFMASDGKKQAIFLFPKPGPVEQPREHKGLPSQIALSCSSAEQVI